MQASQTHLSLYITKYNQIICSRIIKYKKLYLPFNITIHLVIEYRLSYLIRYFYHVLNAVDSNIFGQVVRYGMFQSSQSLRVFFKNIGYLFLKGIWRRRLFYTSCKNNQNN